MGALTFVSMHVAAYFGLIDIEDCMDSFLVWQWLALGYEPRTLSQPLCLDDQQAGLHIASSIYAAAVEFDREAYKVYTERIERLKPNLIAENDHVQTVAHLSMSQSNAGLSYSISCAKVSPGSLSTEGHWSCTPRTLVGTIRCRTYILANCSVISLHALPCAWTTQL